MRIPIMPGAFKLPPRLLLGEPRTRNKEASFALLLKKANGSARPGQARPSSLQRPCSVLEAISYSRPCFPIVPESLLRRMEFPFRDRRAAVGKFLAAMIRASYPEANSRKCKARCELGARRATSSRKRNPRSGTSSLDGSPILWPRSWVSHFGSIILSSRRSKSRSATYRLIIPGGTIIMLTWSTALGESMARSGRHSRVSRRASAKTSNFKLFLSIIMRIAPSAFSR